MEEIAFTSHSSCEMYGMFGFVEMWTLMVLHYPLNPNHVSQAVFYNHPAHWNNPQGEKALTCSALKGR
jgi:hypothetical protein